MRKSCLKLKKKKKKKRKKRKRGRLSNKQKMIALQPTRNSGKEPRQGAPLFPRAPGSTVTISWESYNRMVSPT